MATIAHDVLAMPLERIVDRDDQVEHGVLELYGV